MTTMTIVLYAVHAALAIVCIVGWRVELGRVRGWRIDPGKPFPDWVKRFYAVGEGPLVVLGTSQETSFDHVSAAPELESAGFELQGEGGVRVEVPKGTKIQIRAVDGASRKPLDAITKGAMVKPRFTFEVPPTVPLYTFAEPDRAKQAPYRGSSLPMFGRGDKPLVLAGEPVALVGTPLPGCWLFVLFAFVGVGAVLASVGMTEASWALAAVAALLLVFGGAAMPSRPPAQLRP